MNMQEVFDTVARHLLKQMSVSMGEGGKCAYRGQGGKMCAVGVLIKDECYFKWLEDQPVLNHQVQEALMASGVEMTLDVAYMLKELQSIHDYYGTANWAAELYLVARDYGLETTAIDGGFYGSQKLLFLATGQARPLHATCKGRAILQRSILGFSGYAGYHWGRLATP
ncbi:MAG: hypothetical protein E6Q97_07615 [Desulfurellales bacterium]|nr:MAG: hypothetical protein E6Q97_07615 [Desulfurellales bacterium]